MKRYLLVLLGVVTASVVAAQSTTPQGAAEPAAAADSKPAIEHDGQVFTLAASTTGPNVETDEYVLNNEKIADWTQLLTVQRLTLAKPSPADEFLAYFQQRIQAEDGASLDVLQQGRKATVFAVRFPKTDRNDEQVMICLAFLETAKPELLNIVQYAIKPGRHPVSVVESRIRSWRDKFVRQAVGLAASTADQPTMKALVPTERRQQSAP